jgi:phosphate transport system substrate-binding protein
MVTTFLRPSLLLLALMGVLLPGCRSSVSLSSPPETPTQAIQNLSTRAADPAQIQLNGAGATFPLSIYTDWMYAYSFIDPALKLDYQGIGSGNGKKAIIEGTVDFAGSDSLLKDEEYEAGKDLQMYPILAGAVVVTYNIEPSRDHPPSREVPTLVLDRQLLVDIYNGTVNQWNDPRILALNAQWADDLPEAPITVVHRSDASGTTELFTRALTSFSANWTAGSAPTIGWPVDSAGNGVGAKGNQGVTEVVTNTANSIGYVELSYAISNHLVYADLINQAGQRVTANAGSLEAAIKDFGTAAFDDKLTAVIMDGHGEGSWPIAGYTYLILHTTSMTDCLKAQKLLEYIQWTLTNPYAGERAAQRGYVVLPPAVRKLVLTRLGDVTCNGQSVRKAGP